MTLKGQGQGRLRLLRRCFSNWLSPSVPSVSSVIVSPRVAPHSTNIATASANPTSAPAVIIPPCRKTREKDDVFDPRDISVG